MNIAICDDNRDFRVDLENNLRFYFDERSVALNILHFSSGEELISSDLLFDLVFLDVEMGELSGISAGRELKRKNRNCIIFIVTSHDGYLDDAFNIQAFRFLQKPVESKRLNKALDDAAELMNNDIVVFHDIESNCNSRIYANDIIYVEIENKKIKIITVNGTYISNERISWWRNKLNGISFVTPHSSYIANIDYAICHARKQLVLAKRDLDGNVVEKYNIPIAPRKQAEIKRQFFYILERR